MNSKIDSNFFQNNKYNNIVYVPNKLDGYSTGRIVDVASEYLEVELFPSSLNQITQRIKLSYNEVLPAGNDQASDVNDCCSLLYLNDATLLNNCSLRYKRKQIYTYVGNILISINPYEYIPNLYDEKVIKNYIGKSLGNMPPHIFSIADQAYRKMKQFKQSQSIIVSGESGAGKTESQKYILHYLCHCWGSSVGSIEQHILETNPILEAFGNAKTLRNNNSSRFGKFIEIYFDSNYKIAGGFISHYLLEKTRVCYQQFGERNFHIFYQLFVAQKKDLQLKLTKLEDFKYLRNGSTHYFTSSTNNNINNKEYLTNSIIDDDNDFNKVTNALTDIGFTENEKNYLFKILAGILHLGNIDFEENVNDTKGGISITKASEQSLNIAAEFLGLNVIQLRLGLTTRCMQPTKNRMKGTIIMVPLKCRESSAARDALAKALYSRLFNLIVNKINNSIPFESKSSNNYIGVLDVAGFEYFELNQFEQFCINYCNERLQHFFNEKVFNEEQRLYAMEHLDVPKIMYKDNTNCIELFEAKKYGLIDLLNEEARLPKPLAYHFTLTVHQIHQNNKLLNLPIKSIEQQHRTLRDDEGFIINHYASPVCYKTSTFLEKNNDALHFSLEILLEESSNILVKEMIKQTDELNSNKNMRKLCHESICSKFRTQLLNLINKLTTTNVNFIRCIKPNDEMQAKKINGALILKQLQCSGITDALKQLQIGYPSRVAFADLYSKYEKLLPPNLAKLDPRMFCKVLFNLFNLTENDYSFGLTKVFFRAGKFAEFDQLIKEENGNINSLILKAQLWINRNRWHKAQFGILSIIKMNKQIKYRRECAIRLQCFLRGTLARKRFQEIKNDLNIKKQKLIENNCPYKTEPLETIKDNIQIAIEQNLIDNALQKKNSTNNLNYNNEAEITTKEKKKSINVSSWTYAQIREIINDKYIDINLRNKCQEEYYRRMNAYKNWKLKNIKSKTN